MTTEKSKKDKKLLSKAIRTAGDTLIQSIKEEIFLCEISSDDKRFSRLMHLFNAHLNYEFIKSLREAGLSKEITKLADKAGHILKERE